MPLSSEEVAGLGVAFNEARWLGAEVALDERLAAVTLSVLSLPAIGPQPEDRRIQVLLRPIGRVWIQRTSGEGALIPMELSQFLPTVEAFGGCPIYGWEFIDAPVPRLEASQLSVCVDIGPDGLTHNLHLFQDGGVNGHLDAWLWFDELKVRAPNGAELSVAEVIAGGRRWWDGLHAGDQRTSDACIFPLKRDTPSASD